MVSTSNRRAGSQWATRSSSAPAAGTGLVPLDNLCFIFPTSGSRCFLLRREKPFTFSVLQPCACRRPVPGLHAGRRAIQLLTSAGPACPLLSELQITVPGHFIPSGHSGWARPHFAPIHDARHPSFRDAAMLSWWLASGPLQRRAILSMPRRARRFRRNLIGSNGPPYQPRIDRCSSCAGSTTRPELSRTSGLLECLIRSEDTDPDAHDNVASGWHPRSEPPPAVLDPVPKFRHLPSFLTPATQMMTLPTDAPRHHTTIARTPRTIPY